MAVHRTRSDARVLRDRGWIGIALGLGGALGMAHALHVPGIAMPIVFGVSVLIGIVFGVFPARKASRLHPLAALRFE